MTDIELELRALGERVGERAIAMPVPRPDIVRRARVRRIIAGVTALGVVALTAIGGMAAIRSVGTGGRGIPGEDSVLAAAADATEAEGTARIEFEMAMKSDGGFMTMDAKMHGSGEIDFEAERSYSRFEIEGVPMAPTTSIEMIQDRNDVYTKMGDSTQWTKTSASELSGGAMNSFSGTPSSPDEYLEQLRSISHEIDIVGTDEVDGVSTTRYRATIDAQAAMALLQDADESVQRVMSEADIKFDPMEVWVDSDDLVRRITSGTEIDMGGAIMAMDFSMRFYDFGAAIDIEIPDANDIVEQEGSSLGGIFGGAATTKMASRSTRSRPLS